MKGQIAMWMLTKMAMIFFIVALALIITSFGNTQRASICSNQALFTARAVGSAINNVLISPVEDERKVFSLESSLSLGREDFERYEVTLLKVTESRGADVETGYFSVDVHPDVPQCNPLEGQKSASCTCSGSSLAPFKNFDVEMISHASRKKVTTNGEALVLQPSNPQARSRFLVVIKCKQKTFPPRSFIFIEDCLAESGDECLGFSSTEIDRSDRCGFP